MKIRIATAVVCLALAAPAASGQTSEESSSRGKKIWWASVAAVIGASVFDAQSSWGRQELNPALRGPNGEFGARGVAMKAAIAGGVVTAQYFLLRKHSGAAKYAAITNFGMASLLTGAAVYNHNRTALPPPAPVPQPRPAYLVAGPVSAETGGGQ